MTRSCVCGVIIVRVGEREARPTREGDIVNRGRRVSGQEIPAIASPPKKKKLLRYSKVNCVPDIFSE